MRQLRRVVWREGMHLAQHHFQAQARYFESSIDFALSSLAFAPYGTTSLELDAAALRNGIVALTSARGVMPDGLPFAMPDGDPLPTPRPMAGALPRVNDDHVVVLAVPPYRPDGANVGDEQDGAAGADGLRFTRETVLAPDDALGRDVRPVLVGRKNFRLMLDNEAGLDGLVTLPIARVHRNSAGELTYDADFIPPSLQIGGSAAIMAMLGRLVEMLEARRTALAAERRAPQVAVAFGAHEVTTFWLLHTINSALAPLRHLLGARQAHPERLYVEMARLAGALCTFSLASSPGDIPPYDHERLADCLGVLDRHIGTHLNLVVPTSCVRVPLRATADYMFEGEVTDQRALGSSRWVLGVRSRLGVGDVAARVPSLVKICSGQGVSKLVQRGLPGMTLTYLPSPPSEVTPRSDTRYFAVTTSGPCWEHTRATRAVGVYTPVELQVDELDLAAVVEQ
jgi:type VI secretion system protein ImpJ